MQKNYESFQCKDTWENKAILILLLSCVGGFLFFVSVSKGQETRKITDTGLVLLEKEISPDQRHIALSYQYDQGALGYSRIWWAVVPHKFEGLNLTDFELPDSYKIVGWDENNGALIVAKWEPYYYRKEHVELSKEDLFHGVRLRVLPSSKVPTSSEQHSMPQ